MGKMQKSFDSKIKELMHKYPDLFPTEAKFWAYLRGCLRRGLWEKSPMKFRYKSSAVTKPPVGYTGKGRKGAECALTGVWTPTSKMEVDHINGNVPLQSEDDILDYIIHLLASDDELQLVSKEAHKIKNYQERMGITFEEAKVAKKVIAFSKQALTKQLKDLQSLGVVPDKETKKACKEAYRDYLNSLETD